MLNLIEPVYIGKCVNLIYQYKKTLLKCIEERLWVYHMHRWWSPYEFALEYGRSWILAFGDDTEMKCPYQVLKEGLAIVEKKRFSEADRAELSMLEQHSSHFKEKIDAYYLEGWDKRLKESILANKWV